MIGGSFNRLRDARVGKWGKGAVVVVVGLIALDLAANSRHPRHRFGS